MAICLFSRTLIEICWMSVSSISVPETTLLCDTCKNLLQVYRNCHYSPLSTNAWLEPPVNYARLFSFSGTGPCQPDRHDDVIMKQIAVGTSAGWVTTPNQPRLHPLTPFLATVEITSLYLVGAPQAYAGTCQA